MSLTFFTSHGNLKFELFCEEVPTMCENFLALAASDYYNGTIFHRNVPEFIVQGGDPTGTGKGGESIYGRYFDDEIIEDLKHKRGSLSMASLGSNKNASQFFISYGSNESLDGKYSIFGQLVEGLEVLNKMEKVETDKKHRPLVEIKIEQVEIHANPFADKDCKRQELN